MRLSRTLSFFGSGFAIGGALLVALNVGLATWGYAAMTIASACLLTWAIKAKERSQCSMYIVYIALNIIGIIQHAT